MNTPASNSAPTTTEELANKIKADLQAMLERGAAGKPAASETADQQGKAQG